MIFRRIALGLSLVFLLALGWRYRHAEALQGLLAPPSAKPLAIPFDNGTVRQYQAASAPVAVEATARPLGSVRKCRKGTEISYTNSLCPPGAKELELSNGTLNVLNSAPAGSRPTGPAPAPVAAPAEPTLAQRRIERLVNP
jgi:hypothetical protein